MDYFSNLFDYFSQVLEENAAISAAIGVTAGAQNRRLVRFFVLSHSPQVLG